VDEGGGGMAGIQEASSIARLSSKKSASVGVG